MPQNTYQLIRLEGKQLSVEYNMLSAPNMFSLAGYGKIYDGSG